MSECHCDSCGRFMHYVFRELVVEAGRGEIGFVPKNCKGCGEMNIVDWTRFQAQCVENPGDVPCLI